MADACKTTAPKRKKKAPRSESADRSESSVVVDLRASADGTVSAEVIKAATRHFDLEAVTKLVLTRMAIRTTKGMGRCVNLEELDLGDNAIESLVDLHDVKGLRKLTLTNNKLSSLEGLSWGAWPAIEHVFVQANAIATVDALHLSSLARLATLKSLYLKNFDGSQPNPICSSLRSGARDYREAVLKTLPKLRNLDGERLRDVQLQRERERGPAPAEEEASPSSSSSLRATLRAHLDAEADAHVGGGKRDPQSWFDFDDDGESLRFRTAQTRLEVLLDGVRDGLGKLDD